MIEFSAYSLFPDFILADKNGYAMVKAIESALQSMCAIIQNGVDTAANVEKMPEWRLDELAWEYNCAYDYSAPIDAKRRWIRDAISLSGLHGTPEAIRQYLLGYFQDAQLEERPTHDVAPYHFRISASGLMTSEDIAWSYEAAEKIKNVRSIFDGISFTTKSEAQLYAGCALHKEVQTKMAVPDFQPEEQIWYTDEADNTLIDERGLVIYAEVKS